MYIDPSFQSLVDSTSPEVIANLINSTKKRKYILHWDYVKKRRWGKTLLKKDTNRIPSVCLWILDEANESDVIKAFYHSSVLRMLIEEKFLWERNNKDITSKSKWIDQTKVENFVDHTFPIYEKGLKDSGWNVNYVFIAEVRSRIRFNI